MNGLPKGVNELSANRVPEEKNEKQARSNVKSNQQTLIDKSHSKSEKKARILCAFRVKPQSKASN